MEHLQENESLNIVFKSNTSYVTKEDITTSGLVLPYVLHNIEWYKEQDGKLIIQFRKFYMDGTNEHKQNTGIFETKYINKYYISKVKE